MYKNQLQELAQRSCFNLPSYACTREGPDHAPRFRASVNFNGEIFESPTYCSTLRQAEHAAAEVALRVLSLRGPSRSLTARVLDETGVYKNLLQETAHRAGLKLPVYTTVRSGPGHVPIFTCCVELAGMSFTGESARTKKQAEKNVAIAAWSSLKRIANFVPLSQTSRKTEDGVEQDQITLGRGLSDFGLKRDQKQAGRKMLRVHNRDGTLPSNSNAIQQYEQRRLFMDLLMDSPSSEGLTKKQNLFVSLLPPPPRTTSKILPPIQVMKKSQEAKSQEVPPPLDEHQRDEDEWLNGNSETTKKPTSSAVYNDGNKKNHKFRQILPNLSQMAISSIYSGKGFQPTPPPRPQRIAPPVQIRSVIPVCAAPPPPPMRTLPSNPPSMKEPALAMSTHGGAELSSASSSSSNSSTKQATVTLKPTYVHVQQEATVVMKEEKCTQLVSCGINYQ